ncbi:MAG: efflux RND transporter periplasmic adaptor subunit [Deltaproteobacteria bacterium]|nr:efflux RND transporter periplasmic adaptor subunit [Deltaproteobacteria bacterium]
MSEGARWSLLPAGLALACAVACGNPSSSATGSGPPPATVEVATATPGVFADVAEFTGALLADESVVVKPETSGTVDTVEFREGQEVAKGALLFTLRDDEQRARLEEARAALQLAERNFKRVQSLQGENVMAQEELDRSRAELTQAKARVDLAEVLLARTEIRAPFDGVLGPRLVSPGDRVNRGGPSGDREHPGLVQIDAIDQLKLVFTVPEVAINAMRVGTPVEVSVTPFPGERFPGEIYFVAPSLDPLNRRLLVKALIPNPEKKLRAGLSTTVHLEVSRRDDVIAIPESAIVHDVAGAFVWRLKDDGTAERVQIRLGARRPGEVEVSGGLAPGDRVVSAGVSKVSVGRPLQIAPAEPVKDAAAAAS